MRICLVAHNRFHSSPRARVTHYVLTRAGHEVVVVAVDPNPPREPVVATVPKRSTRPLSRLADRLRLTDSGKTLPQRLAAAAAATGAGIYLPLHNDVLGAAVTAARQTGGVVQRTPNMSPAGEVDLIDLAPARPHLAMPTAGLGTGFTPGNAPDPYEPKPGRHLGERVVLCYRKTATNPGRYLEAALERSGVEVRVETDHLDLGTIDPATRFVLFVESPYPAIDVHGATDVPVLSWVHHGEHHLPTNLRLSDRYRADAVLLAHSWHLAHWFPAPIHRFPFAVPPELVDPSRRLADRQFDVTMVGANLSGDAWQYQRRARMVKAIESHLPSDRIRFVEGISPREMTALYGDSRIVLNEGGARHYPITMRVFEALGSGAALLTDEPPGLETIFDPGLEFTAMSEDVTADVDRLLGDLDATQEMCDRALNRIRGRHTYDHRVDDLMRIAETTTKREISSTAPGSELARLIDADVEVQRLVHDDEDKLAEQLPDREVWAAAKRSGNLAPRTMDAAVITEAANTVKLADSARRFIYARSDIPGVAEYVESRHPNAATEVLGSFTRIDLMSESYRVSSAGRPR